MVLYNPVQILGGLDYYGGLEKPRRTDGIV